jgi:hypothetical protein
MDSRGKTFQGQFFLRGKIICAKMLNKFYGDSVIMSVYQGSFPAFAKNLPEF